jgi:hypothetical protein
MTVQSKSEERVEKKDQEDGKETEKKRRDRLRPKTS